MAGSPVSDARPIERGEILRVRVAGAAGVVAALAWVVGDILLVGHVATIAEDPRKSLLGGAIDLDIASRVVGVSTSRLIAGALLATFTVPLYLAATWHLWRGIRAAGRAWALPAALMIFIGYALSPLPHAAFYFFGAALQALLTSGNMFHPQLLPLTVEFQEVLLITWYPAVALQLCGMLWLSLAIASGRTAYPPWLALTTNPIVLGLLIALVMRVLPVTEGWLGGAVFNIAWLLVYAQSLYWFGKNRRRTPA